MQNYEEEKYPINGDIFVIIPENFGAPYWRGDQLYFFYGGPFGEIPYIEKEINVDEILREQFDTALDPSESLEDQLLKILYALDYGVYESVCEYELERRFPGERLKDVFHRLGYSAVLHTSVQLALVKQLIWRYVPPPSYQVLASRAYAKEKQAQSEKIFPWEIKDEENPTEQ